MLPQQQLVFSWGGRRGCSAAEDYFCFGLGWGRRDGFYELQLELELELELQVVDKAMSFKGGDLVGGPVSFDQDWEGGREGKGAYILRMNKTC